MVTRLHPPQQICDDAEFYGDTHRLWLSRKVGSPSPRSGTVGLIIGLNPSIAGAESNDQTIRKETEFARRWGWSGFWKLNLFTVIETNSRKLRDFEYKTAVGSYGSEVLENFLPRATVIVVCWGVSVPKQMRHRIPAVCARIKHLRAPGAMVLCFGASKNGHPRHPSRLGYDTKLEPFDLEAVLGRPSIRDADD